MGNKIQMVDLQSQYERLRHEIDPRVQSIMQQGQFIHGPSVGLFESELQEFLKVKHVIGVGNGTDALQLAFMALDLQEGDEVIIPSFAYAALPEVLLLLNLNPIYVDVDDSSFCLDVSQIEQKITNRTKAIAVVHLFGGVAEMEVVNQIAKKYGLFVIEDTAQSIGAEYCSGATFGFAGCLGDIGTTSFFPSKNLGCYGDGGAVFTNNDVLAEKIRKLANHGQSKKYYHELVGVNSRLDTIQAEILRVKLTYLIEFNQNRFRIAEKYIDAFSDLPDVVVPCLSDTSTHVFHQFTIRIKEKNNSYSSFSDQINESISSRESSRSDVNNLNLGFQNGSVAEDAISNYSNKNQNKRDRLRDFLTSKGVPSMVYYPLPLHQQKAYFQFVSTPIAEQICNEVVSLPICPELTPEYQDYIINTVREFFI